MYRVARPAPYGLEDFNTYCDTTPSEVFKFCMEKVHCVCNSVTKPCAKPNKDRCPKAGGVNMECTHACLNSDLKARASDHVRALAFS